MLPYFNISKLFVESKENPRLNSYASHLWGLPRLQKKRQTFLFTWSSTTNEQRNDMKTTFSTVGGS